MKLLTDAKFVALTLGIALLTTSCIGFPGGEKAEKADKPNQKAESSKATQSSENMASKAVVAESKPSDTAETAQPGGQPKTVRDFFMLLPEKYFTLEGCDRDTDAGCKKARLEYLKALLEIEDTPNGYLKGGCDGGQSCIDMALFKRPGGSYLIGIETTGEMIYDHFFLDYKDGKWEDISAKSVPGFSKKNIYELPRYGTTVKVFAKKIIEEGDGWEAAEKGAELYELEWKDGKFIKK